MVRPIDNSHLSCLGLKLRVEAVSQQIFEECSVARGLETERPESRKFTRLHVERLAPVGGEVLIEPTPLVRQLIRVEASLTVGVGRQLGAAIAL